MTEVAEEKELPSASILPSYQLWGFSLTKDNYNAVLDRFHFRPGYEPTTGVASGGFATWEKNSSASERIGLVDVSVYTLAGRTGTHSPIFPWRQSGSQ